MSPVPNEAAILLPALEGVRFDRSRFDLGEQELHDAMNLIRRDGKLQTRAGLHKIGDPIGQRPTTLLQYDHDDEKARIVCATTRGWHVYDKINDNWIDITATALTGTPEAPTVFAVMSYGGERVVLGTNGLDPPKKWVGTSPFSDIEDIGGSPPKAKCLAVSFNRLILANITSGPNVGGQTVYVSDYRNPDAGWGTQQVAILLDVEGDIVSVLPIGNRRVAFYHTKGMYLGTAIGTDDAFRFDHFMGEISGPVSALAAIDTPHGHIFLARDGTLRMFDGSNVSVIQRDLSDDRIHSYIRETMNFEEHERTWLAYDHLYDEVQAHYVPVGSADVNAGFVVNMSDLSVWPARWPAVLPAGRGMQLVSSIAYGEVVGAYRDHPETYASFDQPRRRTALMDANGQLYELWGSTDAGVGISHSFETGCRAAGDPRQKFVIRQASHLIKATGAAQNVTIAFGASQHGEDPVYETGKVVPLTGGGIGHSGDAPPAPETHHKLRGSFFSLKVSGTNTGRVEYSGHQVVADPIGYI